MVAIGVNCCAPNHVEGLLRRLAATTELPLVAYPNAGERYADYSMCGSDGEAAAGVCHARGMNADQPAGWMIYLPVGDLAESLRLVEEEGGKVIRTAHENDAYAFAIIQDPVGVHMGLVPGGGA